MRRTLALLLAVLLLVAGAGLAEAKKKRRKKRKKKAKAAVTVPVNVGFGPTFNMVTGPIQADQEYHYGLRLELAAIIDKKTIKRFKHKIPKKYRKMATSMGEFRYKPSILIPSHLFVSPRSENTGMYGVSWTPVGVSLPILPGPTLRLNIGVGLQLTYAYIATKVDGLQETIHFLRPGLEGKAELTLKLSDGFLISGGWASSVYIPQKIKGEDAGFLAMGSPEDEDCIWHIGQIFAMLHFRFPYTTRL